MIKVTFKEIQEVYEYGLSSECLFIFGIGYETKGIFTLIKNTHHYVAVPTDNIKSIENVKPTDL